MALTIGTGPLGEHPSGRFDVPPPARPLLFWEPFPKRLRLLISDVIVVDSRRVVAVHETGEMMRLAVPWQDVSRAGLQRMFSDENERLGRLQGWAVRGRGTFARSVEAPPRQAAELQGLVLLDLEEVDAWYLEDELGYAHPRDPYHRFDVHRASRQVTVKAGGTLIAEVSMPAILFETSTPPRFYLPPDAVRTDLLLRSETVSQCPYKGDGQHWHIETGGDRIEDAGWSLTTPMGDALTIPRWFSFYPEKTEIEIDGERL